MGNRRAGEPLSPVPLSSAQARSAFAEDDAMVTCPECGAGVRPDQEWCTLCLHVLRAPEPPPAPAAPVVPAAAPIASAPPAADIEATADAMLAQLAVATRTDRLAVPSFLDSKAKI